MKLYPVYFTFLLILFTHCKNTANKKIAIQPFEGVNTSYISEIKKGLDSVYGSEIIVFEKIELPKSTFINVKSPRYRADKLIKYLKENKADSIDYVIGITNKDISTTKNDRFGNVKEPKSKYQDWGIFGLGYRPGPSCVVSTFRLKHRNNSIFVDRIKKVAAHEIGHNLGLKHCKSGDNCLMKDAVESIKTVDSEVFALCGSCESKIR